MLDPVFPFVPRPAVHLESGRVGTPTRLIPDFEAEGFDIVQKRRFGGSICFGEGRWGVPWRSGAEVEWYDVGFDRDDTEDGYREVSAWLREECSCPSQSTTHGCCFVG